VVGYDAAAQHLALATELRAARKAREDLGRLRDNLDANDLFAAAAFRLGNILAEWDATPRAVLDHQPEPSKER
jgi:hypothetical protein